MSISMKMNAAAINIAVGDVTYSGYNVAKLADLGLPATDILAAVKSWLKAEADATAEAIRSSILTPGAGQAMEYQETQAQAFAAIASPDDATADKFPMLAATIGLDVDPKTKKPATDVVGVARSVLASFNAWASIGAAIRGARLSGKAAIDSAATIPAACDAFDAIAWPKAA